MEEDHEVYGGEIPVKGELEGDIDPQHADVDMYAAEEDAFKGLDEMKKRLNEMEEEAAAFREMKSKVKKEMGAVSDPSTAAAPSIDARSVYVSNVDYACPPEEVQQHFQSCGTVNRVTILTDNFGQPMGFAYVEFLEVEAVRESLRMNGTVLHGRLLKVIPKRTNAPVMKQYFPRRRGFNPYIGAGFRRPYAAPYFFSPYGFGKVPQYRRLNRYMPYF